MVGKSHFTGENIGLAILVHDRNMARHILFETNVISRRN